MEGRAHKPTNSSKCERYGKCNNVAEERSRNSLRDSFKLQFELVWIADGVLDIGRMNGEVGSASLEGTAGLVGSLSGRLRLSAAYSC
jgi:hypothetical protein